MKATIYWSENRHKPVRIIVNMDRVAAQQPPFSTEGLYDKHDQEAGLRMPGSLTAELDRKAELHA